MVELTGIERTELTVKACMLRMARHASTLDATVDSYRLHHAVRDGFVTCETPFSRHFAALRMALLTICQSFKRRVRPRKRTGRDQSAKLRFGAAAIRDPRGRDDPYQNPASSHAYRSRASRASLASHLRSTSETARTPCTK